LRAVHILHGDSSGGGHKSGGGGHKSGAGRGKSEFPASWTEIEILSRIVDVANDANSNLVVQPTGRWKLRGIRQSVWITVIADPKTFAILTGFPA